MGNYEKKLGLRNRKLIPDLEPSRCVTQPTGPKKKPKRYRAEQLRTGFLTTKSWWSSLGTSNDLDEARHLMLKPQRDCRGVWKPTHVRIVESATGAVVEERVLQPRKKQEGAAND